MPLTPQRKKIIFFSLIVVVILSVAAVTIVPFGMTFFRFLNKFHELGNVNAGDTGYPLNKTRLALKNISTGKEDAFDLGGTRLVNIWASWCTPCIEEVPSLHELHAKRPDIEVALFSFDDPEKLKDIYDRKKWKLPAYSITDSSIFEKPQILPVTYILKDYRVVGRISGAKNWNSEEMVAKIDSLSKMPPAQ